MITISINPADLQRLASKFGATARELEDSLVGATNDVAKTGRNQTRRIVRAYINLPAKSVNPRVAVTKRASKADPVAIIGLDHTGGGRRARPTLMSFGGRPSRPYYESAARVRNRARSRGKRRKLKAPPRFSYQLLKGGPRKTLPSVFVARVTRRAVRGGGYDAISRGAGNVVALQRTTGRGFHGQKLAAPRGPSIAAIWQNQRSGVAEKSLTSMRSNFARRIEGRLHYALSRRFKKG